MRVTSSHMATKNSGKPIANNQMRWLLSMTLHLPSMIGRALTLYLRESGDAVHRITKPRQQPEPHGAHRDRKSVVAGTRGPVRVDRGVRGLGKQQQDTGMHDQ